VSELALALRDVHRRFGATVALEDARCLVRAGTVHALLGENGAGKTTLMRIAFGMLQADAGVLERDGRAVRFAHERDAIAAGIGMVHQHFMLIPAFTVAENVSLGGRGRLAPAETAARIRSIGTHTGLRVDPDARIRNLPVGAQQRAELVRALAQDARLLILDEPTAVLTPLESEELYGWMRRFAATGGTVVLITHKLREALAVADDVTVLRRGRTVLEGRAQDIPEAALVTAIVGEGTSGAMGEPLGHTVAPALFALHQASWADARGVMRLAATSLEVRAGEILGVLGVEGAGQRELLRLLAGRLAPTTGRVAHPARVGFIPEDRLRDALIPAFSLTENHALADAAVLEPLVRWQARRAATGSIVAAYDVRTTGPDAPMATLSGGNQQRFVVGRERALAPEALVAENPTRGLDVRATNRVLNAIRDVATHGGAAVVYSADLDEILALTRRVVVCFGGRVTEVEPPADPSDRSAYARAMLGVGT
jgi:ABC-type uncharacterized transport system ATPase subunit